MASLTQWAWVWVDSRSWWWTGRPGVLWFMGSQRVGHEWATELSWTKLCLTHCDPVPQWIRLPCPSLSPYVCSNSYPLSWWCYPTIIRCHPLPFLPSIFRSTRNFSNELALSMRWLKYWSFSFSISPSNEYSGLISCRIDCLISLQSKGLSRVFSSSTVQKHKFFSAQPSIGSNSHICTRILEKP